MKANKLSVGGQAVIEGVMMRGSSSWAVAVRKPDGEIAVKQEKLKSHKYFVLKWPLIRGVVVLIQSLIIGFKALSYSADLSAGKEEQKISSTQMTLTFVVAFVFAFGLFFALPYFITHFSKGLVKSHFLFSGFEGIMRLSIFLVYLFAISSMKDIRRVFQYHGAEHKVVNNFDSGLDVNLENASKFSTRHYMCGTSFLLVVMAIAILAFSFLPTTSFFLRMIGKILAAPLIAGISYELIRLAGKRKLKIVRIIMQPGLWLQKITTKEPTDDQIEVAMVALNAVLRPGVKNA